jgi:hypothetical protein
MYSRGADDIASKRTLVTDSLAVPQQDIIDYAERSLTYLQLVGEDRFEEARNLKLNWNGGLGQATMLEPDARQFQYQYNATTDEYSQLDEFDADSGGPRNLTLQRFQRELTENNFYAIADITIPMFEEKEKDDAFKTGFYQDYNVRDYDQSSFVNPYGQAEPSVDYTTYTPTDGSTWADVFLAPGQSGLVPTTSQNPLSYTLYNLNGEPATSAGTQYHATQSVTASYIMADFKPFPQLKLTGGARFENTDIKVSTQEPESLPARFFPASFRATGVAKIQQLDLLPAAAATFQLTEGVNFRFAWSQTLARPSFKELGPVVTKNFTDDTFFLGNPELQLSKANNYDFRTEWFPRAGEVVAVSLFYKKIIAPMEQTAFYDQVEQQQFLTYTNAPSNGIVYGVELETRKRLDQIAPALKNFSLYFNYSQIISSVPVSPEVSQVLAANNQPTESRPLQGQPEYIINAGLNYDNDEYRFYAGIFFNVTGPFLFSVGEPFGVGQQATYFPDVYEQPAPSLDFNLTQGITENWKLTFRGKNLLNPFFNRTQTYNGTEYIYSSYTKGWDLSLNATYGF